MRFFIFLLSVFLVTAVSANTTITYQGQLTDPSGSVDGSIDLSFELFDSETDGTSIAGPIVRAGTEVSDGLFQVDLDFGNAYAAGDAWLQISVEGQPLSPRQRVSAAPLAVHALNVPEIPDAWQLGGNAGIDENAHFLGTADTSTLTLRVNNITGLRLQPGTGTVTGLNEVVPNVIAGSGANDVTGVEGAVIAGGGGDSSSSTALNHLVTAAFGTIGGGIGNTVNAKYATVSGGRSNLADATSSTVGGGWANLALRPGSTVSGGFENTSDGIHATVPGGFQNEALGGYSFAAGWKAQAHHQGAFVWADAANEAFASTADNEFAVRAGGGVRLVVGDTTCELISGESAFNCSVTSDRHAKTDLQSISGVDVLDQVAELPLYRWRYNHADVGDNHLSPMAQDFAATFGLGADPKRIRALDVAGVALAAIQGLNERNNQLEAENARLRERLDELAEQQASVEALQNRLARIENVLLDTHEVAEVSE